MRPYDWMITWMLHRGGMSPKTYKLKVWTDVSMSHEYPQQLNSECQQKSSGQCLTRFTVQLLRDPCVQSHQGLVCPSTVWRTWRRYQESGPVTTCFVWTQPKCRPANSDVFTHTPAELYGAQLQAHSPPENIGPSCQIGLVLLTLISFHTRFHTLYIRSHINTNNYTNSLSLIPCKTLK